MAGSSPQSGLPSCTRSGQTGRFPSFTPAYYAPNVPATPLLRLRWSEPGTMTVRLPWHGRDASRYDALTFRASGDGTGTPSDLVVSVVDGAGRTASVPVSALSDTLAGLPGGGDSGLLPKVWLRTVSWPVERMRGVNVHDLREIRFRTAGRSGGVFLSDLALARPAVGRGGPSRLPQVSVRDTTVPEGDGPGTVTVLVRLDRPSWRPVSVHVQVLPGTAAQVNGQATRVVVPAGRVVARATLRIEGDDEPGGDARYQLVAALAANGITSSNVAHLVVRDDERATAASG